MSGSAATTTSRLRGSCSRVNSKVPSTTASRVVAACAPNSSPSLAHDAVDDGLELGMHGLVVQIEGRQRIGMADEVADRPADQLLDDVGRRQCRPFGVAPLQHAVEGRLKLRIVALGECIEHLILVAEEVIDRADRGAGALGGRMHAHGREPGLRDQGRGRIEQLLATLASARLPWRTGRGPRRGFRIRHIFPSHVTFKLSFRSFGKPIPGT